jgi:hypothetical protein
MTRANLPHITPPPGKACGRCDHMPSERISATVPARICHCPCHDVADMAPELVEAVWATADYFRAVQAALEGERNYADSTPDLERRGNRAGALVMRCCRTLDKLLPEPPQEKP